jgi:hypothetical protein
MRIDERRPNLIASDAAPFASRGSALRTVTGSQPKSRRLPHPLKAEPAELGGFAAVRVTLKSARRESVRR